MLCAAMGLFEYGIRALLMNSRQQEHFMGWARPFHETIAGRIGYIPGLALHLWHGEMRDRQYGVREQGLQAFDLDPFVDIALVARGCWRWSDDTSRRARRTATDEPGGWRAAVARSGFRGPPRGRPPGG